MARGRLRARGLASLSTQPVMVLDPMLATGGSLEHCVRLLASRGMEVTITSTLPAGAGLRVVHLMGFFGGVLDWVLALGVGVAAWGEAGDWSAAVGTALARPGKVIVLAGAADSWCSVARSREPAGRSRWSPEPRAVAHLPRGDGVRAGRRPLRGSCSRAS